MGDVKGAADGIKEELGWLKVLFAVLAANYAVWRKLGELKNLS